MRDLEYRGHVFAKVQLLQRCLDVLARYCLLCVLFGDLIGLGGDERDELDAALYEQVPGIFRERHARFRRQDVLHNLLHRRWTR